MDISGRGIAGGIFGKAKEYISNDYASTIFYKEVSCKFSMSPQYFGACICSIKRMAHCKSVQSTR